MLYEEFNSISRRNAIGKTKGHSLFNKLYVKLLEQSYDRGYSLYMSQSCDKTGWPIDIFIKPRNFSTGVEETTDAQIRPIAVYFLLQEELCTNALTGKEEPLALQKIMLRHLKNISKTKVVTLTENEVYADIDSCVAKLISQAEATKRS